MQGKKGTGPFSRPLVKLPKLDNFDHLLKLIDDSKIREQLADKLEKLEKQLDCCASDKIVPVTVDEARWIYLWHQESKKIMDESRLKIPLKVQGAVDQYLSEIKKAFTKFFKYFQKEEQKETTRAEAEAKLWREGTEIKMSS